MRLKLHNYEINYVTDASVDIVCVEQVEVTPEQLGLIFGGKEIVPLGWSGHVVDSGLPDRVGMLVGRANGMGDILLNRGIFEHVVDIETKWR